MNCNTCRAELSMCLDGRLASGRRHIVLQHVDNCASCRHFWDELQRAQALTLQLPRHRVGDDFQQRLWERIRAGEGTPEAVFHEPIPLLTKARYVLTGAAAAAAMLATALWLRPQSTLPQQDTLAANTAVATEASDDSYGELADQPNMVGRTAPTRMVAAPTTRTVAAAPFAVAPPMLMSAQPLTADAVAVEAARQFEQRYLAASRRMQFLPGEQTVRAVLDDAQELHLLAEVLLDLRDHDCLSFRDAEVGADLRVVANLLGQSRQQKSTLDTVRAFVAPALQQSERLQQLARLIRVRPAADHSEQSAELELLRRLSTQRPDVMPKLFFILPGDQQAALSRFFGSNLRFFDDVCGPSFVAPRSRVAEGNQRFAALQLQLADSSEPR